MCQLSAVGVVVILPVFAHACIRQASVPVRRLSLHHQRVRQACTGRPCAPPQQQHERRRAPARPRWRAWQQVCPTFAKLCRHLPIWQPHQIAQHSAVSSSQANVPKAAKRPAAAVPKATAGGAVDLTFSDDSPEAPAKTARRTLAGVPSSLCGLLNTCRLLTG